MLLFTLWYAGLVPAWGLDSAPEIPKADSKQKSVDSGADSQAVEKPSVTHHTLRTAGGGLLTYSATAGYLRLVDESGKPQADIFFTAYTVEGQTGTRPVTFAFNGGPGASSGWLHMGIAGPVRAITGEKVPSSPPWAPAPNPCCWLPWTDLVFIDPVGTGFSRSIPAENAKQYFNTPDDVRSVGNFIQLYIDRFNRWGSLKCLAGESYGATRAAGLLPYLYENFGIEIDGLILISPALDLSIVHPDPSNDLPYMLFAPSYAATAWYHKKTGPEFRAGLTEVLAEAERWTIEEYLPALAKGRNLSSPDTDRIAARLASLAGLPEPLIKNRDIRIPRSEFMAELLRSEGLSLGSMDGRTTQPAGGGDFLSDPAIVMTVGPYTAALNGYMHDVLKFSAGIPYVFFSHAANSEWNWGAAFSGGGAVQSIRQAVNRNGRLKIFAAAGYFDLVIPYFAATYVMSHLGISHERSANIRVRFFQGGHMFYTSSEALEEFTSEIGRFFVEITGARPAIP
jgi:carboxypeptidase C (cathepsin A)